MVDREEVLASVLHPLHRALQAPGQIRDQEVLGIELAARAEPAADVGFREVDPRLVEPQHGGERPAIEVRDLRHAPHGQAARVRLPFGQQPAGLHRRGGLASDVEALADDAGGAAQRGLDVAQGRRPGVGHVALGKQKRARVIDVDARRQDVVLDLDELARVDGGGAIGRDQDRDRLADVADPVAGQRRLQIGRVRRLAGLAERDHRHAREIGRGQAGHDTRLRERSFRVHSSNVGVGVGASHDDRVHRAGSGQVVHVAATAREQPRVFEPLDRGADELHWRGNGTIRS